MKKKIFIISGIVVLIALIVLLLWLFLFKGATYTITFDSDGGSKVESVKVKKGKTIELPEITKEGYTLDGWYDGSKKVDNKTTYKKNTTLKAKWLEGFFKVSFDTKGGSEVASINVECGKELNLPENPTKEGYNFLHWEDQNEMPILDQALLTCDDVTLYAKWEAEGPQGAPINEPETFKVSFDTKGGSNVVDIYVECGKELKLPANPTKSGYNFGHWEDKNGTAILDGALLTCHDITLSAVWDAAYTCPSGYELSGTKCKSTVNPTMVCPSGTREDGDKCVKLSDYTQGERSCGKKTVVMPYGHTEQVQGTKVQAGTTFCYYGEVTDSYENNPTNCTSRGHKWSNSLNKCFYDMDQNFITVCPANYDYYSSDDILNKFGGHNNGGCYRIYSKEATCSSDYTLTSGKCVKTINATKK